MAHKFNPANIHKLESPQRRELLPPEKTLATLGFAKGLRVLDIGCGSGYFSLPAAGIVGVEGFVYGVDISSELVEYCINKAQTLGTQNTKFLLSQEATIPLPDNEVDIALMVNVMHELLQPADLFKEVKRVLKADGKLIIVEWKKIETQMGPPVSERLDIAEAGEILKTNGFFNQQNFDLGSAHYGIVAS